MQNSKGSLAILIIIGLLTGTITAGFTWYYYLQTGQIGATQESQNPGPQIKSQKQSPQISGLQISPVIKEEKGLKIITGSVKLSCTSPDAVKVEFYYLAQDKTVDKKVLIGKDTNSEDDWSVIWNTNEKGKFWVWAQAIGQDKRMNSSYRLQVEVR